MNTNNSLVINLLKYTFGLIPIVAGLDKFLNILTDWEKYIPQWITQMIPLEPEILMMIVGVIEIIAGVLVLTKTRIGAPIVSGWLALLAVILLSGGNFIDVAVRDLVMSIAAFSLYKLDLMKTNSQ